MELSRTLLDKITKLLIDRNENICVAESVTSGLLQTAISQMHGAENFFHGGITAYTLKQQVKLLSLDLEQAKKDNCVSRSISEKMAVNVSKIFNCDWSLSTTGYATPVEESDYQIFAYYCIAYYGVILRSDRIDLHPLTKAADAQKYFAEYTLGCLESELQRPKRIMSV